MVWYAVGMIMKAGAGVGGWGLSKVVVAMMGVMVEVVEVSAEKLD